VEQPRRGGGRPPDPVLAGRPQRHRDDVDGGLRGEAAGAGGVHGEKTRAFDWRRGEGGGRWPPPLVGSPAWSFLSPAARHAALTRHHQAHGERPGLGQAQEVHRGLWSRRMMKTLLLFTLIFCVAFF